MAEGRTLHSKTQQEKVGCGYGGECRYGGDCKYEVQYLMNYIGLQQPIRPKATFVTKLENPRGCE